MFTPAPLHEVDLVVQDDTHRLLTALLEDRRTEALLDGQQPPTPAQVALTLRALADFPLCMRILPIAGYRRLGDQVTGVATYLTGFAEHLARYDERVTYDPRYWILGAPVTDRLMRTVAALAGPALADLPTGRQSAVVLQALADTATLALPRRVVTIAGDGDLPWNGATGIGLWFRQLADTIAPSTGGSEHRAQRN